jgi:CHAT domain-containing protein/tetratricopeptide (TPR) repeat protein
MALQNKKCPNLHRIGLATVLAIMAALPAHAQSPMTDVLQQWQSLTAQVAEAFQAGDYTKGSAIAEEALRMAQQTFGDRDPRTLTTLNSVAFLYRAQGRNDEAEALYREALQARRAVLGSRHPDTLQSLNNLAVLYLAQGRYGDAEPLLQEVLPKQREVLGPRDLDTIASLNNLASVYRAQGRYGQAEPLFREAQQQSRDVFGLHHRLTLSILGNLGGLYVEQGRYGEAEPLYRETLRGNREVHGLRHPDTLRRLDNLAVLYDYEGRYAEAEELYLEALQERREVLGPRHPNTIDTLSNLALFYGLQGRYGDAEPLLLEALQASREVLGSRHPLTLLSLDSFAGVYKQQGRDSEAELLYGEALQGRREVLGPRHPDTLSTQLGMVTLLISQGQLAKGAQMLKEMEPNLLGWVGQEIHSTVAGAVRRQLVSSQAAFQDAVLTMATAKESGKEARRLAATVILHFKVLQGEEEAYLARLTRQSQLPQVRILAEQVSRLRTALVAAAQGAPDALEKTLQALEAKRQALVDVSPDYKNHLQVQTASFEALRAALPAGAVLIELRQFRPVDFRTGKPGERRFAGLLLAGFDEPVVADLGLVPEFQQLATSLDDEAAAKLYQRLFAPFENKLAGAKTVYVAPDGILNLVPFARLKLPDGRYWWERLEVHLLQTGRDLLRPNPDGQARGLLALGGIDFGAAPTDTGEQDNIFFAAAGSDRPAAVTRAAATFRDGFKQLPATLDEVKDVTEWYQLLRPEEPTEIWSKGDANKARLMALKAPPRVLHLATHGFYRPNESREPMLLSGIALAGANRELAGTGSDGILFALEAEALNLDGTELVVLSACDTAQGGLDYSEGVFGLARALRTAGARNVLVTLWKLKDGEARRFVVEFYKNWLTQPHSDPAQALRDTQLSWIRQHNRLAALGGVFRRAAPRPRAWAPYVLIE